MKRFLSFVVSIFLLTNPFASNAQAKLSLLPGTMKKYVGKITYSEFEKIVGTNRVSNPDESSMNPNMLVGEYLIINTHTNSYTNIVCNYQKSDSLLVSVHYPSKSAYGYKAAFEKFPGFSSEKDYTYWEAPDESVWVMTFIYGNLNCRIEKDIFLNYDITYTWIK